MRAGPQYTKLDYSTVHLWFTNLDLSSEEVAQYRETLSVEERAIADRFIIELDRSRYIVAHGVLRSILGGYLGVRPDKLTFSSSRSGKPELGKKEKDARILFNLSHSYGRALFGIAYNRDVGVDLEFISDNMDYMCIAENNFSRNEYFALHELPMDMKKEAFFRYWTCKEAFLKAVGLGLSLPLDKVEVSPFPDDIVTLLGAEHSYDERREWKLRYVGCEHGYAAAVVAEGKDWDIQVYQW